MSVLDQKKIVETGVSVELKFETYLVHGRSMPRARSSTVERYLEHGGTPPKNVDCPAVIRSK